MTAAFNHGVTILDGDTTQSISVVSDSVIGIVGIAENADPTAFPLNTPVLVTSRTQVAQLRGTLGAAVGDTLPEAMDAIFDQCTPVVTVIRVAKGVDATTTAANVLGSSDAGTGVWALQHGKAVTGQNPALLCAPGFTSGRAADTVNVGQFLINPVVAALNTIASGQRAVAIIDGPNTTEVEAIATAAQIASKRVLMIDPAVQRSNAAGVTEVQPASAAGCGVVAAVDANESFSVSPSNHAILNIVGLGRPIDYSTTNPSCRATLLNAGFVATIINEGGLRLWGNRCTDGTFLAVVRTSDVIDESIQAATQLAIDKRITKTFFEFVVEEVNAFLRDLKASGDIVDGKCWVDPDLNTDSALSQGKAFFNVAWNPCYPAESITFTVTITNDYLSEVL